jgi:nucleotide-binding universal stress UspA family protein
VFNVTTTASPSPESGADPASAVFDRVLCGVDRTDAGLAAARVAARVCSPQGSLVLVSVEDRSLAVHAGWAAPLAVEELDRAARSALDEGRAVAEPEHAVDGRLVVGRPLDTLAHELKRERATLAVVGRHERVRAVGMALGSVATHLLHEAPCPVLVVPPQVELDRWPRSIVVGLDGSASSTVALVTAQALGTRFAADVRAIVGMGSGRVDLESARAATPRLEESPAHAVEALVDASEHTDLLVLGSRGLRGIRALGSVSERVAHEAAAPVLVVRPLSASASSAAATSAADEA